MKVIKKAALRGCEECADFEGRMAGISVGATGSEPGYTYVECQGGYTLSLGCQCRRYLMEGISAVNIDGLPCDEVTVA